MRKLISSDEGVYATKQHTSPCSDCPWRRDALPGWLGGEDVSYWLHLAHNDVTVDCHTIVNQQCAGMAIYRSNVAKSCRGPMLKLPSDKEQVFATPMEFRAHHESGPGSRR